MRLGVTFGFHRAKNCRGCVQRGSDEDLTALMRAAIAGDKIAYQRALQRLAAMLRLHVGRALARYGRGPEDIEDVVQEALLAVHLKRHTWDEQRPLEPWVRAIATYKLIDHLRRNGLPVHVHIDEIADALPSEDTTDVAARIDRARLLMQLNERQRSLVEAIAIDGRSAREVAQALGTTEGAIRVALHRALRSMAKIASGGRS